jgi:hypothetical protein
MAENWREFPAQFSTPANSQLFGHLLAHAGFEGVLFSSNHHQEAEYGGISEAVSEFGFDDSRRRPAVRREVLRVGRSDPSGCRTCNVGLTIHPFDDCGTRFVVSIRSTVVGTPRISVLWDAEVLIERFHGMEEVAGPAPLSASV